MNKKSDSISEVAFYYLHLCLKDPSLCSGLVRKSNFSAKAVKLVSH